MWSAECERDGPSVSMIAWSDSDSVAFGISSIKTDKNIFPEVVDPQWVPPKVNVCN